MVLFTLLGRPFSYLRLPTQVALLIHSASHPLSQASMIKICLDNWVIVIMHGKWVFGTTCPHRSTWLIYTSPTCPCLAHNPLTCLIHVPLLHAMIIHLLYWTLGMHEYHSETVYQFPVRHSLLFSTSLLPNMKMSWLHSSSHITQTQTENPLSGDQ